MYNIVKKCGLLVRTKNNTYSFHFIYFDSAPSYTIHKIDIIFKSRIFCQIFVNIRQWDNYFGIHFDFKSHTGVDFTNLFLHSFYAHRSQNRKKTVKLSMSVFSFRICMHKSMIFRVACGLWKHLFETPGLKQEPFLPNFIFNHFPIHFVKIVRL